jgi:hypothetical protein
MIRPKGSKRPLPPSAEVDLRHPLVEAALGDQSLRRGLMADLAEIHFHDGPPAACRTTTKQRRASPTWCSTVPYGRRRPFEPSSISPIAESTRRAPSTDTFDKLNRDAGQEARPNGTGLCRSSS